MNNWSDEFDKKFGCNGNCVGAYNKPRCFKSHIHDFDIEDLEEEYNSIKSFISQTLESYREDVEKLPPLDTINTEEKSGYESCRRDVLKILKDSLKELL